MDGLADGYVFALNLLADSDAGEISFLGWFRNIRKIIVEDDFGSIDAAGNDEVSVHDSIVNVDHKVGIDPVVKRSRSGADCGGFRVTFVGCNRT